MRRVAVLLVMVGCSGAGSGVSREEPDSGGSGTAERDASEIVDAGREDVDVVADAALDTEAGQPQPGLFDQCGASNLCPAEFSHPLVGRKAAGVCWGDHTTTTSEDMFERCTFSCHNPNAPQGLDPELRRICEESGGECWPWRSNPDGIPICMPKT